MYSKWFVPSLCALLLTASVSSAAPAAPTTAPTPHISKIAPGEYQCFYVVDGKLWGIGSNRAGELGIGLGSPLPPVPAIQIKFPADVKIVDAAAGGYHGQALDSAGHVWAWGSNTFGQKGDGSALDKPGVPVPEANGLPARIATDVTGKEFGDVISIVSGWTNNLALKKDGTVWVWGRNEKEVRGSVGNGDVTTLAIDRPTQTLFDPTIKIVQIDTAGNLFMARDSKGGVWSWGGGEGSKVNRGSGSDDFARPHQVLNLPPATTIAVGDGFNYALDADGHLWGWGSGGTFLGIGPATGGWVIVSPARKLEFPEFAAHKITAVAVSGHTTHVILDDGSLWGWGDSAIGEVGNGQMLDLSKYHHSWDWGKFELMVFRPVRIVPEVSNFTAIYSNAMCFYTYAVTADDKVYSWGRNKTGILGDGILPTGNLADHPDSWNVPTATQVWPLAQKPGKPVPSKP